MAWTYLILAGAFEVVGVTGINLVVKEKRWQSYLVLFLGFLFSFGFLSLAMRTLPMGMSYAIWTGIGTVGGVLVGMLFYGEPKDWKRILFIGVIISAVLGLRLAS
ncbi:multidrug efflux SMR transporter [Rossellomorea vietnamensis]|uniref:Multidrug efflux SMR transporter n=2 Tax=Rossellomorea TaxID=2837508 RepID=A0A5D4K9N0_9BACI|nr:MULTISPECIES: multidrug efflux SMR transporter [Rossellomorea]TYR73579.1 multidrug efflux SMR transporter [Rossellomorea vietnamensis]TYS18525.1 multidrug efflux SMR transporter [Rossellomorea vietnamensis]TYS75494.1 multidrug efflux SMR transporter [Rossellomorea aquimaris]